MSSDDAATSAGGLAAVNALLDQTTVAPVEQWLANDCEDPAARVSRGWSFERGGDDGRSEW